MKCLEHYTIYIYINRINQIPEIAVPWRDPCAVFELGLWSILSTAAVVNRFDLSYEGQTKPSSI